MNMTSYSELEAFPKAILAVNSIGLAISFAAVVMRLWTRLALKIRPRLSDYTIIASWVSDAITPTQFWYSHNMKLFTLGLVISENLCVTRGGVGKSLQAAVTSEELLFSLRVRDRHTPLIWSLLT